jgi:MFS family permease
LPPLLLPSAHLSNAVTWSSSTFEIATMVGPAIGGLLGTFGPRVPFFVAAGLAILNFIPDYAPCSAILSVVQIANIIDFRGFFDGAQQGAVPEGAQRACIRTPIWHRGTMSGCCRGFAVAEWL